VQPAFLLSVRRWEFPQSVSWWQKQDTDCMHDGVWVNIHPESPLSLKRVTRAISLQLANCEKWLLRGRS